MDCQYISKYRSLLKGKFANILELINEHKYSPKITIPTKRMNEEDIIDFKLIVKDVEINKCEKEISNS